MPHRMASPSYLQTWQRQLNNDFFLPTHNNFGPLSDMIGDSLSMDYTPSYIEPAQAMDAAAAQNKRRKFSAGATDMNAFNQLPLDDKISQMMEKLNNLELSQRAIDSISQHVTQTTSKVEHMNTRMSTHDNFFRLLAYKSIDIEARSRRKNLIFHGLAESKNENCKEVLRDFLWNEMGLDLEDFYIERVHRLGSLQKAMQRRSDPNSPVIRPLIVAFYESPSVETVMETAYMLRNSPYSVTRDYPLEIKNARKRLMPSFIKERQNKNNKVSIEYPARLVINGKTVMDEFPDWHIVLNQDRYQLVNVLNDPSTYAQIQTGQYQAPPRIVPVPVPAPPPPIVAPIPAQTQTGAQGIHNDRGQGIDTDVTLNQRTVQPTAQRTYSQVVRDIKFNCSPGDATLGPGDATPYDYNVESSISDAPWHICDW